VNQYLLDTSVIIDGDPRSALPDDSAISVVTLGELRSGVLLANDPVTRAQRSRRFVATSKAFRAIDVDARVAERCGEIFAFSRLEGRVKNKSDMMIVATAAEHALTLFTLDEAQGKLAEDLGLLVEYGRPTPPAPA
jgi:predicted nucleic acid-binding protein